MPVKLHPASGTMVFSPTDIGYFLEVFRLGNLGRAAQECGVSQPSISKALRRLENATGVPLFVRGAHGVTPTGDGLLFVELARRYQLHHAELVRAAIDMGAKRAGLLRVGVTNAEHDSAIVQALAAMMRRRPALRLRLSVGLSDALDDAVALGELDTAFIPTYPGISYRSTLIALGEDRVRVAARVGHPLAARDNLTLADLASCPWAMSSEGRASHRLVMDVFARAGVPRPLVALENDFTSEAVVGLLARTDLLSLIPEAVLRNSASMIRPLPVPALTFTRTLALLTRPQGMPSPLLESLRDTLTAGRRSWGMPKKH